MKWMALALLVLVPQEESTLRVAWGTVRTVDPALAILPQDVRVTEALFEGLGLTAAKTDGAVVTFTLPDLKWTDGRPVTASDYRFAWMRCLDPATGSPWAFRFRHIKNARAWHEAEALSGRLLLYESEGPAGRAEIVRAAKEMGSKRHAGAMREAIAVEKDERLKAGLEESLEAAGRREDLAGSAVGIRAVNARTLEVTLESPRAGFAQLASTSPFLPVPEHVVKARRDQWTHPDTLVTCGEYKLERWTRDGLVLARSGAGDGPARVAFATADRAADAWTLYERGVVDWLDRSLVPPEKLEALAASGELRSAPGAAVSFLRLSDKVKPGLRRAIALGIDRAALAKRAGPGSVETRSLAGSAEGPARDLVAAMAALAGEFPDLKLPRLRLLVWKDPAAEELARAVREQVEEALAVSVRIDLREGPPYRDAIAAGDFDLALTTFAPEAGDPAGVLDLFAEGRAAGEKPLLESALAVPLVREGEWFVAKPRVQAKWGMPLSDVRLTK